MKGTGVMATNAVTIDATKEMNETLSSLEILEK
jgi:hypothetical protein